MDAADELSREHNLGYGSLPLGPRDIYLADVLEREIRERGFDAMRAQGAADASVLTFLAERLASVAVRTERPDLVRSGLKALALATPEDLRETLVVLPLLRRAADLLDVPFAGIVEEVAESLGEPTATVIRALPSHGSPSVESMGYREVLEAEGFRFERCW